MWPHIGNILGITNIRQKHREPIGTSFIATLLSYNKIITNNQEYVKIDDRYDSIYRGLLTIKTYGESSPICFWVKVEYADINKPQDICLTFFDGYDYLEFLYDYTRRIIVKNEEKGLSRAVKYRRYEPLYSDEYYFSAEFTNDIPNNYKLPSDFSLPEIAASKDLGEEISIKKKEDNNTYLSEVGLSSLVLNCLKKSNIYTVEDVINKDVKKLGHIRGLNKKMHKELMDRLYSLGFKMV